MEVMDLFATRATLRELAVEVDAPKRPRRLKPMAQNRMRPSRYNSALQMRS